MGKSDTLSVSEHFYSIQGEGPTAGTPSVFLRLQGCNLTCGGQDTVNSQQLDSGATWRCDTIETWLKGDALAHSQLLDLWKSLGYLDHLSSGAHLVITGGEPLLQTSSLEVFLQLLCKRLPTRPFIELETNGTRLPSETLASYISQFNISPKLSSSGMTHSQRVFPDVMSSLVAYPHAFFKFVVLTSDDVDELNRSFVVPFSIGHSRVVLMPAASSRESLLSLQASVAHWAHAHGFLFSTRLQVLLWDQTVGV